ncbi:hypothetical protein GpartN1_g6730.t1 [Galdieria partita]|uniref:Uncharacterized protein n=1 Tax=Galdieria partita TaxID=83374 RepID=A0A9C7Q248_9RHOD|nr:hypothetical protein GpartN1_g6730.t1 [Galdieria partita]
MNFSYEKLEPSLEQQSDGTVAKVLSEALCSQPQWVTDLHVKEFCEEFFIATLEGAPVAYITNSSVVHREYGFLVTTCALFSVLWYTHHSKLCGHFCVKTLDSVVYFMQFGCLLFVWKVSSLTPTYWVEAIFQFVARTLEFFFSPNIFEWTWLRKYSSLSYVIQENAAFLSSIRELLYGGHLMDPSYLIGTIRCMPSPYPEGRSLLSDSLKPLLGKGALHVVLFHEPSKRFIVAQRKTEVVPLSKDELELFVLFSRIAQERHLDICGYIQLHGSYQLVRIVFSYIEDNSLDHGWLLLFVVKRTDYHSLMNAWSQYKERWIQQLQSREIERDVNGFLRNPLSCNIISDHLKIPFPVHVMFYHRSLQLLVDTFGLSNLFEKDIYDIRKIWTKERVTEMIVCKEKGRTWICQSIGDYPPVNIVLFFHCELDEEHYGQLVKDIQCWFYHKQMSVFPLEWTEYFQSKDKWKIWRWL